ncbi:hypothetical protein [Dawidia soli]|uniref:Uncharacterized protein n=1 Tax=Dawidia soli TaxID=2782352 RepID=A0AAP2GEU0_9BACT|nr:hypothetical protein [Dawidia soli]MBT1688669.1 hypothetical protein [Dawidia soli]
MEKKSGQTSQGRDITLADVIIRTDLRPGDMGFVIHRHGKLYQEEYGYGAAFEAYVSAGFYEFYENYDPRIDRGGYASTATGS